MPKENYLTKSVLAISVIIVILTIIIMPDSAVFMSFSTCVSYLAFPSVAIRRLWGSRDHSVEVEEMLVEQASLKGVHSNTVVDLILDQAVYWQLLAVLVTFNAVS